MSEIQEKRDDFAFTIRLEQMDENLWWYKVEDKNTLNEGFNSSMQLGLCSIIEILTEVVK